MPDFSFPARRGQVSESVVYPEPKTGGAFDTLSCSDAADEGFQYELGKLLSVSGSMTVEILWYADTAVVDDTVWEAALLAVTPGVGVDGDIEAETFATGVTVTTTCSTTAHESVVTTITLTAGAQQDNAATGDHGILRIKRLGTNGSDNMSGDAQFIEVHIAW